jgi:ketosteroid isomerase-like protein
MDYETARQVAKQWCTAWNDRDLDSIMDHYAENVRTEEKLRVIDRKLSEITNKMRQLDDIKTALTEKRCKIVQEEIQTTQ